MSSRHATLVMLAFLLGIWPGLARAQDATPGAPGGRPLDLAAMALAPDDVPAGFFDDYGEWSVPAELVPELVLGCAPAPPGLERLYQSFYFNPAEAAGIHAFLFEFALPAEASAGSAIVDDVLRPPLPGGTTLGPTHSPGGALGEDSSVTTVVTYDTRVEGGPLVDVVAASFRQDRLVAGVAVERYTDPTGPGTPAASLATPQGNADPALEQLANELASRVDDRIVAVRWQQSGGR